MFFTETSCKWGNIEQYSKLPQLFNVPDKACAFFAFYIISIIYNSKCAVGTIY